MSIRIKEILQKIEYVEFLGDSEQEIDGPINLDISNKNAKAIMWVNTKNIGKLEQLDYGTIIAGIEAKKSKVHENCNVILVENPRKCFMDVLTNFFVEKETPFISDKAVIHESAILGENVTIGAHVILEANVVVGDNTCIDHNTVIKKNTIIGRNVIIGANNTIGGAGYGYEKNEKGEYEFIPHLGNVIIKDDVEIGNNTCIDRAVLGSTFLDENAKIDNLVHIAHGVKVGKNSMVIANSMVAGSVAIGEDVWIAPSSSILNQKSIGKNALVGMGAVVLKDVPEGKIFIGNPARDLREKSKK